MGIRRRDSENRRKYSFKMCKTKRNERRWHILVFCRGLVHGLVVEFWELEAQGQVVFLEGPTVRSVGDY